MARRFLLNLLMLVMLTPSLACAMPTCADEKQTTRSQQTPCAEHRPDSKSDKANDQIKLLIDCMGVDLQVAYSVDGYSPDLKNAPLVYAVVDQALFSQVDYTSANIRGPPPDWHYRSGTNPPIILTTQRFRI
ncbi:MAG: hypothetical protein NDJ24_06110 [Alphaproteobacteria bacterium]|nr:hypothetical protein [Alphaproteobacteria bacterium]